MFPPTSVANRSQAVLVVIDVQERLAAVMPHREDVVVATALSVRAAGIVGVPVVVTRQYPQGLGDFVQGLLDVFAQADDAGGSLARVDKVSFDCFAEPTFSDAVCATGRRQLVLAGMESHICVMQTALAGLREGYDVHVMADACCSRDDRAHAGAMARLAHAGAAVTTAESFAYEVVGQAGTPEFKALLAAVKAADAAR